MPMPIPRTTALLTLTLGLALAHPGHATTVDDFVLTGPGAIIAFSLPATPPGNVSPGAGALYLPAIPVNDNGVTSLASIAAPTYSFAGGLDIGALPHYMGAQLFGPSLLSPTFVAGTYTLYTELLTPPFTETFYTLTITPGTAPAPTPEPSTLTQVAAAAICVLVALGYTRSTGSSRPIASTK